MKDEEIIMLIKNNESDKAFTVLYNHFPAIRKMIISNGGSKDDAQDVYQEGLMILYKKIKQPDFTLTAQLNTYLYSVCKYLWLNEQRKRLKEKTLLQNTEPDENVENELNEILEKEEKIKKAEKVINELGERCKELLLLFYSGKMRLKEIMVKMKYASENAVKTQKYKCIEAAKDKLKAIDQKLIIKNDV